MPAVASMLAPRSRRMSLQPDVDNNLRPLPRTKLILDANVDAQEATVRGRRPTEGNPKNRLDALRRASEPDLWRGQSSSPERQRKDSDARSGVSVLSWMEHNFAKHGASTPPEFCMSPVNQQHNTGNMQDLLTGDTSGLVSLIGAVGGGLGSFFEPLRAASAQPAGEAQTILEWIPPDATMPVALMGPDATISWLQATEGKAASPPLSLGRKKFQPLQQMDGQDPQWVQATQKAVEKARKSGAAAGAKNPNSTDTRRTLARTVMY